ncbi:Transposase IS1 family [Flavobacterium indicum GPTSA100-9 = DSM 17447]|uniref:Transposase IS1 family n=1 Tax=Flavobacterium indicum (strain DSM 17447 / CIP 109464 / GPTSA100-9) TaxID=1094466 RepID=H8XNR1_FLAIG|nr:IS1 family transposase [Flavobacterium indicum]CCG52178.1 Transposase IS1 family [Flavobacterium indicum GPTSA100-9 = DSM 17447]
MEKDICPKCNGSSVKCGFQNNVQRYLCKNCNKKFQASYTYNAYQTNINSFISTLIKEGCGIRSISRILKISKNTVLSKIIYISNFVKPKPFVKLGCKFEIDEIWTFIGCKNNMTWITYIIERESKSVIDFFVGSKTKENIKPLIEKVLMLYPKTIFTDKLNVYPSIIPKEIHKRFQYCTNIIERNNLTIRTHVKRLSRRTICFSKSVVILNAILKIYFWF